MDATTGTGRSHSDLDYDSYTNLPYLEAVIKETIRMYVALHSTVVCDPDDVPP